jgi:molybdopterin-guanine dinucleotide biosynthesis protein A
MTGLAGTEAPTLRPLLGAVLAGGRSRRFGRDKTSVEVDGVPMVLRARAALEAVCDDVVIVSSRPGSESWGEVIPDLRPDSGPLAGIESALHHAVERGASAVFVLAADLPHVGPDVVRAVVAAAQPVASGSGSGLTGERGPPPLAAAASRAGEPDFEPLCAVYRVDCADTVSRLLDEGERAARALVEFVDGRKVVLTPEAAQAVSVNVNVPADLERRL